MGRLLWFTPGEAPADIRAELDAARDARILRDLVQAGGDPVELLDRLDAARKLADARADAALGRGLLGAARTFRAAADGLCADARRLVELCA